MGSRIFLVQKRAADGALSQTLAGLGHVVVGTATPARVVEEIRGATFDLALVDFEAREDGAVAAAEAITREGRPFLFLSREPSDELLARLVATRPRAHVIKPYAPAQLRVAIDVALAQDDPRAVATLERISSLLTTGGFAADDAGPSEPLLALSARERAVVERLLAHERVPRIAERLGISTFTVRNHLKSIFRKLGVSSQQELLDRLGKGSSD